MLEAFLFIAVLLVLVTLVGHGLWVAVAALVRAFRQGMHSAAETAAQPRPCPLCGQTLDVSDRYCRRCGHALKPGTVGGVKHPGDSVSDLEAASRVLRRLHAEGRIETPEYERLTRLLAKQQPVAAKPAGAAAVTGRPAKPAAKSPRAVEAARPSVPRIPVSAKEKPTPSVSHSVGRAVAAGESRSATAVEPRPRPRIGQLLQAFLEERNIRWGELVSALLIVGSAVGLVISLWSTLTTAIPYFPALVFLGVTVGIHLAGLYTLRRWRLESTSRGLLLIAVLLAPLNVLAGVALTEGAQLAGIAFWAFWLAGLAVLAWIVASASRVLVEQQWRWLVVGIVGTTATQVFLARLVAPGMQPGWVVALAGLPAAPFVLANSGIFIRALAVLEPTADGLRRQFTTLGATVFSLLAAWGLFCWKYQAAGEALGFLAPFLAASAGPVMAVGLLIHRRADPSRLSNQRTTGTAIALLAMFIMGLAVVLAWPRPVLLLATAATVSACLALTASRVEFPPLLAGMVVSLALAALLLFHWVSGRLVGWEPLPGSRFVEALLMGRSSLVLAACCLATLAAARWRLSRNRPGDARVLAVSAGMLAVVGVGIAVDAGFRTGVDSALAAPLFLVYASGALFAARRIPHPALSWTASALLWSAASHAFLKHPQMSVWLAEWQPAGSERFRLASLLHGIVATVLAWAMQPGRNRSSGQSRWRIEFACVHPLAASALLSTLVVAVWNLLPGPLDRLGMKAGEAGCVALLWAGVAALTGWKPWWTAAEAMTAATVWSTVSYVGYRTAWYEPLLRDPRHMLVQSAALALLGVVLSAAGRLIPAGWNVRREWDARPWGLAGWMPLTGAIGLTMIVLSAILPDVGRELAGATITPHAGWTGLGVVCFVAGLIAGVVPPVLCILAGRVSRRRAVVWIILAGLIALFSALPLERFDSPWRIGDVSAWMAWAWGSVGIVVVAGVALGRLGSPWRGAMAVAAAAFAAMGILATYAEPYSAVATAFRFSTSVYAVVGMALAVTAWHLYERRWASTAQAADDTRPWRQSLITAGGAWLAAGLIPVAALSIRMAVMAAWGVLSPEAGSKLWSASIDVRVAFALPLAFVAVAAFAQSVLARNDGFALLACWIGGCAAATTALLPSWMSTGGVSAEAAIRAVEWTGISLAGAGLVWLALRRRLEPAVGSEKKAPASALLDWELGTVWTVAGIVPAWAAIVITAKPNADLSRLSELGHPAGYVLLALAGIGAAWRFDHLRRRTLFDVAWLVALGATCIAAAGMITAAGEANWTALHALTGGWLTLSLLATILACTGRLPIARLHSRRTVEGETAAASADSSQWTHPTAAGPIRRLLGRLSEWSYPWAVGMGGLTLVPALRALRGDPARPVWTVVSWSLVGLCAALLSIGSRNRVLAYASLALVCGARVAARLEPWLNQTERLAVEAFTDLLPQIAGTLALAGFVWLAVELWWQRRHGETFDTHPQRPPAHHVAAGIGLVVLAIAAVINLADAFSAGSNASTAQLPVGLSDCWTALGLVALLLVGSLWDRLAVDAPAGLFTAGLIATGLFLSTPGLSPPQLVVDGLMSVAGYLLLVGLLWHRRDDLGQLAYRLRMASPAANGERTARWLPDVAMAMTVVVALLALPLVVGGQEPDERLRAALSVAVAALALIPLADGQPSIRPRMGALLLLAVAGTELGWCVQPHGLSRDLLIGRLIRLLETMSAAALVCGSLMRMRSVSGSWRQAARPALLATSGLAAAALVSTLVLEAWLFVPNRGAPVSDPQLLFVGLALFALAAALTTIAVVPRFDPLALSPQRRKGYVYAAELVVALLFVHIYLTRPELFQLGLAAYWPLIAMGIAFFGALVGELCRRSGLPVLADPLQTTAGWLALIPAVGWWLLTSRTDYSGVLFVAGLVYVLLAMLRGRSTYGWIAAILGNAALWAFWKEHGLSVFVHPQLWLIPPAVCVLAATHLNRSHLTERQRTLVRYLAATVIYVSSTGEMFLAGVGESLWMPLILAGLSIAGVLVGIVLRIRAFLYLGAVFLLVSLLSMVAHAAQSIHHVWPWWAFGIAAGIGILVLFGLFEKKRQEMLEVVDRLRQWEA